MISQLKNYYDRFGVCIPQHISRKTIKMLEEIFAINKEK